MVSVCMIMLGLTQAFSVSCYHRCLLMYFHLSVQHTCVLAHTCHLLHCSFRHYNEETDFGMFLTQKNNFVIHLLFLSAHDKV